MFYNLRNPPPYTATEEQMVSYRKACEEQDRQTWFELRLMMAVLGLSLGVAAGLLAVAIR